MVLDVFRVAHITERIAPSKYNVLGTRLNVYAPRYVAYSQFACEYNGCEAIQLTVVQHGPVLCRIDHWQRFTRGNVSIGEINI